MEYIKDVPHVRFVIPDTITVREQLRYYSAMTIPYGKEMFIRYWEGAKVLVTEWECELFPDKNVDLDTVTDANIPAILIWAGMTVKNHIDSMANAPKN